MNLPTYTVGRPGLDPGIKRTMTFVVCVLSVCLVQQLHENVSGQVVSVSLVFVVCEFFCAIIATLLRKNITEGRFNSEVRPQQLDWRTQGLAVLNSRLHTAAVGGVALRRRKRDEATHERDRIRL